MRTMLSRTTTFLGTTHNTKNFLSDFPTEEAREKHRSHLPSNPLMR